MPSEQGRKTLHRRRKRGGSYAGELLTRRPPKNLHTGGRTNEKLKHALAALVVAVMLAVTFIPVFAEGYTTIYLAANQYWSKKTDRVLMKDTL